MNDNIIDFAFLDSGTGGLPYMLYLKKKFPSVNCVYLGDTAHFPYGEKTTDEIISCSSKAAELIINKWHPNTIIIACNTISVTALDALRKKFPNTPFVGTVPAIKLAASVTKNKNIGLLATNATVNHPYTKKLISDFASDCKVWSRGDPDLISFIERHSFTATQDERNKAVLPAAKYFVDNGCDTIILACTHYIHMALDIEKVANSIAPKGTIVRVVDSREGVSNQAIRVEHNNLGEQEFVLQSDSQQTKNSSRTPLYVTGFKSSSDETEYMTFCKYHNVEWGGVI